MVLGTHARLELPGRRLHTGTFRWLLGLQVLPMFGNFLLLFVYQALANPFCRLPCTLGNTALADRPIRRICCSSSLLHPFWQSVLDWTRLVASVRDIPNYLDPCKLCAQPRNGLDADAEGVHAFENVCEIVAKASKTLGGSLSNAAISLLCPLAS